MVPVGLLTPLMLTLAGVVVVADRTPVRVHQARTAAGAALAALLIASALAPASAKHVVSLPEPTGEYAVGVNYLHLVDEERADPFLDHSAQPRELMVKLYYPAVPDPAQPFARYFHGSTELTQAFAEFFQLPGDMLDQLRLVNTHAKESLTISPDRPAYPVILFSHGAGTSMEVQTAQSEDLASHGYFVAAIDHTYVSAATEFPGGRIVRAAEATTVFNVPEPAAPITQIMADDVQFVIEELQGLTSGEGTSRFEGRLNLDALGVIGHSVGGAVAYNLAITDPRVSAAVNLDGAVYVAPGTPDAMAPFLMVASDSTLVPALEQRLSLADLFPLPLPGEPEPEPAETIDHDDAAIRTARQNMASLAEVLQASGNLYTVTGCDHMQYTDIGLYFDRQTREQLQILGETDPVRCLEVTSALTVAFFDHTLRGQPDELLPSLVETEPELVRIDLN